MYLFKNPTSFTNLWDSKVLSNPLKWLYRAICRRNLTPDDQTYTHPKTERGNLNTNSLKIIFRFQSFILPESFHTSQWILHDITLSDTKCKKTYPHLVHSQTLTWNLKKWCFQKEYSFPVWGSMLNFKDVGSIDIFISNPQPTADFRLGKFDVCVFSRVSKGSLKQ